MAENIETRISSEQAKEAIYKINKLSEKGLSPEQIADAVEKVSQISSTPEEIDNTRSVNPNTFVLDGDSIAFQNSYESSYFNHNDAIGFFTWGNFLSGGIMNPIKNNGVGGNRTDQLLARLQASIDLKPRFIYINIGANDIGQGISTSIINSHLLEIATRITKAGIICIFNTITPHETLTTRILATYEVNKYIKSLQNSIKNVLVVDAFSSIVNPSTDLAFSLHTRDGIHPSTIGAYKMGVEFYKTINKYITPISLWSGGNGDVINNLISNPCMLGGTTTATGWTINILSGTAINSKVARSNGLEWQEIEFLTLGEFRMTFPISTNFVVGDKLKLITEIEVDSNITTLDYISNNLQFKTSGGATLSESSGLYIEPNSLFRFPNIAISGVITTQEKEVPNTCGLIYVKLHGKALGKIRLGRCRIVKVV